MIGQLTAEEMEKHVAQADARAAQIEATRAALTIKYMAQGMSRKNAEEKAFQEVWAEEEAKIREHNASRLPAPSNKERVGGRRKTKRRKTKRRKSKARRKNL
jgi:hypothetical protein